MAKSLDIIKIGFDYRASLEQFVKETNGVFDGISEKAGKQKVSIQLDAKNDKVIEKIKELQKLKLDKFTFEFGESGLAEQLKTFDQLEKKITEIINLSKGLGDATSKINSNQSITGEIDAVSKLKDIVNKTTITFEDFKTIIANLPSGKIGQLNKMLNRTLELTSDTGTSLEVMTSELGKFFTITGTRSSTSFFLSNEGEFTRKPNKNKTDFVRDKIYTKGMKYNSSDVASIARALEKQEQQAIATAKAQERLAETEKNLGKSTTVDNSKLKETINYYREIEDIQRRLDDSFVQNRQLVPVAAYGFNSIEEGEKALTLCNEMIAKMKEYYSLAQGEGYSSNALKEMSDNILDVTKNIKPAIENALNAVRSATEQRILDNEIGLKIDNSKSNAPKELLDEYIGVVAQINKGLLNSQDGINLLNTKAKELGVTFDATSKKWVNIATTSSSSDINESSAQIDKLKNKLDELSQRYEELSKSTIVSGKDVDLVDNEEFQKLSKEFATLKQELSDIKIHMELFEQSAMSYDAFIPYENQISELSSRIEKLINDYRELAIVQKDLEGNKSNISSSMKDTFQGDKTSESLDKVQTKLVEVRQETEKTASTLEGLFKGRDIVSQVDIKALDSNGAEYTEMISFIERLQDGQLRRATATWDKDMQKWQETTLTVSTAFEKLGNEIISLDNQINKLESDMNKTKQLHPTYDTSADEKLIALAERRQDSLLEILSTYSSEKEYIYEISAFEQRRLENAERLKNVTKKQENLSDAKQAEKEAKELLATQQQITKEAEKQTEAQQKKWQAFHKEQQDYVGQKQESDAIERNKSAYQELLDTIKQYSEVSKRIAKNETLDGDLELAQKLENKIYELQKQPILSPSQVAKSERELVNLYDKLDVLERGTTEKNKQSTQSKVDKALVSQLSAWKSIHDIRRQIAETDEKDTAKLQALNEEKKGYWKQYREAEKVLKANEDLYDKESQLAKLEHTRLETNEKINKLKLNNVDVGSVLSKGDSDLKKFEARKNQSEEYRNTVEKLKQSIEELRVLEQSMVKSKLLPDGEAQKINEAVASIEEYTNAIKNMPAGEKGSDALSRDKWANRIREYMDKNTRLTREFREELENLIRILRTGGDSVVLKDVIGQFEDAKFRIKEAGLEGKSFFDIFKNKAVYGFAAKLANYYLSFYDWIRYTRYAINALVELDSALLDLKKTTSMTENQLEDFYYTSNDVAKRMGVTTASIIEQASAWSRFRNRPPIW